MIRHVLVLFCIVSLCTVSFAAPSSSTPDKAYLQKILDGWSSMNPANQKDFYAQNDRLFFDIVPVKYNNWAEYQAGVTELFKSYKSMKLTLNDDAQIHHEGNLTWAVATVKEDAVTSTGKHELGTFRWTILFQKVDGKWLVVHEHTSLPAQ